MLIPIVGNMPLFPTIGIPSKKRKTMYYLGGHYVPQEEAKISILDLAILRGFGVFDYLRTYNGRPFHLRDHLERLNYSTKHVGLTLPHSLNTIEEIIDRVLNLNALPEASLKILVTGGISPDQFTPTSENNLIVFAYPLTPPPQNYYLEGIRTVTTRLARSMPTSKTTQYAPAIVALQQGKAQEAKEALYVNVQNEILEGTTSNFFAFKGDTLYTCFSEDVLIGITREVVLKLAAPHFKIEARALHTSEIPTLDEAFVTASNKEVMPVTYIDSIPIGNGRVGPRTNYIMQLFNAYTQSSCWTDLNIPRYRL